MHTALFLYEHLILQHLKTKSKQDGLYNKNLLVLKFGFTMIKLEPDISLPGEIILPDGS